MKAQEAIKILQELNPNEDIVMDYYLKSDFDHVFELEELPPLTDTEWSRVGKLSNKVLTWYGDMEELVRMVINERGQQ